MFDIEIFLQEKLNPVHRAWYAAWAYWWPLWRGIHSGRNIQQKWQRLGLVKEGQSFLDYGCGPGVFTIPAARIIGDRGKVFALDLLAMESVKGVQFFQGDFTATKFVA